MKFADSIKGFVSKTTWKIEKHTPEILLTVGIVTTIGAVVTAVRAAKKAEPIIEEHNKRLDLIHKCEDLGMTGNAETGENVEYTHEDAKNETIKTYLGTTGKLAIAFTPTAILLGTSIVSQVCGYKVMSKRLAEASAAYALLASKFKSYRKRVAEKLGVPEERLLYHDMKAVDVVRNGVDENGNPVESGIETVFIANDDDYTAIFTQYNKDGIRNPWWYPDSDQNLDTLRIKQDYWTKVLKCRKGKPVTLNEVRYDLGLETTQKGQSVGWVYDPDNPEHNGDNYIDFGLDPIIKAYRDGEEMPDDSSFVLDFNVDGEILYAF